MTVDGDAGGGLQGGVATYTKGRALRAWVAGAWVVGAWIARVRGGDGAAAWVGQVDTRNKKVSHVGLETRPNTTRYRSDQSVGLLGLIGLPGYLHSPPIYK